MASHQGRGHRECGRGEAEPPAPLPASPRAPRPGYTQEAVLVLSTTRRVNKHPGFNCCHAQTCLTAPGLRCHLPLRAQHLLRAPAPHQGHRGRTLRKDRGCLRCRRACSGRGDGDVPLPGVLRGAWVHIQPPALGSSSAEPRSGSSRQGGRGSRSGCGRFGKRRGSPKVSCLRQGGDHPPGGKTPVRPAWLLCDLLPVPAVPGQDAATSLFPFLFPFPFHPGANSRVGGQQARVPAQPLRASRSPAGISGTEKAEGAVGARGRARDKASLAAARRGIGMGARARTHHAGGAAVPHGSAPRSFPRRV